MFTGNHLGDSGWSSVFHCPDHVPDIIKAITFAHLYTLEGLNFKAESNSRNSTLELKSTTRDQRDDTIEECQFQRRYLYSCSR